MASSYIVTSNCFLTLHNSNQNSAAPGSWHKCIATSSMNIKLIQSCTGALQHTWSQELSKAIVLLLTVWSVHLELILLYKCEGCCYRKMMVLQVCNGVFPENLYPKLMRKPNTIIHHECFNSCLYSSGRCWYIQNWGQHKTQKPTKMNEVNLNLRYTRQSLLNEHPTQSMHIQKIKIKL